MVTSCGSGEKYFDLKSSFPKLWAKNKEAYRSDVNSFILMVAKLPGEYRLNEMKEAFALYKLTYGMSRSTMPAENVNDVVPMYLV